MKGIMKEDTYYSSVGIGTGKGGKEGKQERQKKKANLKSICLSLGGWTNKFVVYPYNGIL